MSKPCESTKEVLKTAQEQQKPIQNIHIAFKLWMENHAEYVNLRFIYGPMLFVRDLDGQYVTLITRLTFEVFEEMQKTGVTYKYWNRKRVERWNERAVLLLILAVSVCFAILIVRRFFPGVCS